MCSLSLLSSTVVCFRLFFETMSAFVQVGSMQFWHRLTAWHSLAILSTTWAWRCKWGLNTQNGLFYYSALHFLFDPIWSTLALKAVVLIFPQSKWHWEATKGENPHPVSQLWDSMLVRGTSSPWTIQRWTLHCMERRMPHFAVRWDDPNFTREDQSWKGGNPFLIHHIMSHLNVSALGSRFRLRLCNTFGGDCECSGLTGVTVSAERVESLSQLLTRTI